MQVPMRRRCPAISGSAAIRILRNFLFQRQHRGEVVRKEKKEPVTTLLNRGDGRLELTGGWEMASDSLVTASPKSVFDPSLDTGGWCNAIVPGTVLGTLVDCGVYPDPYYGIDNLRIPDSLCRTLWWYRIVFPRPEQFSGRVELRLEGINYRAGVEEDRFDKRDQRRFCFRQLICNIAYRCDYVWQYVDCIHPQ